MFFTTSCLTRQIYWPSDMFDVVKMLICKAQYHCHSLSFNTVVTIFLKNWQYSDPTPNFSFLLASVMEIWLDKVKYTVVWHHIWPCLILMAEHPTSMAVIKSTSMTKCHLGIKISVEIFRIL